ncbi:hypothetical protein [Thermococcus sp. MV5]|uniref:hypothetical protein n=1 Tax=Thermococcus sp. MV5 TaxID=1638272 RepID=UPI00143BD765|nr:hypothetical protein [Thermococcus sp. MV5]
MYSKNTVAMKPLININESGYLVLSKTTKKANPPANPEAISPIPLCLLLFRNIARNRDRIARVK